MHKILCALLILLIHFNGLAQIKFVDTDTNHPISAVNFFDEDGSLVAISNKDGILEILKNQKRLLNFPITLHLQHISYQNKIIVIENLDSLTTVQLTHRENRIEEVFIKKSSNGATILRGYFRSLETFSMKPKQFIDGIIEFYIPHAKKSKIKFKIIENRLFIDTSITKDYKQKMGLFFQIPHIVKLGNKKLQERVSALELLQANNKILLVKNQKQIGYIQNNQNNILYYVDLVLPDSVKKQKLFRLEANTFQNVITEKYNTTNITNASPFNILSVYQNIVASIKRKDEYGHIPYEVINEFFVIEKENISQENYKKLQNKLSKNIYVSPTKSDNYSNYWADLSRYNIPSYSSSLVEKLGNQLIEIK